MKPNDSVMAKLRKILTLANDKSAQPGEVEAAMAKARQLAVEHNIELSSVTFGETQKSVAIEVETDHTLKPRSRYEQPYHKWIYAVLYQVFGVSVIRHGYSTSGGRVTTGITLIGDPFDIAISVAIFPFLEGIFPATLSRAVSSGRLSYCAADTNGCYLGIYRGIVETNKREEEKVVQNLSKDQQNKYALIVLNKETAIEKRKAEMFPKLKSIKNRGLMTNPAAAGYGYAAGKRINLRQVGAAQSKGAIK